MVRNSGKKEFEEFKEFKELKNGSQEPEYRSQEDLGRDALGAPGTVFSKKQSPSAYSSLRASWILAPDSWLLFSNSSNSFFLLLAEDAGS